MTILFPEKSYIKSGGETILRPFSKKSNWAYLWINSLKFSTVCFYCMPSRGLSKYIETKLQITCFYLEGFLKIKKRSGLSLLISFSENLEKIHNQYSYMRYFWRKKICFP